LSSYIHNPTRSIVDAPIPLMWLALAVAAGFLVVASVGFAASTVTSLASRSAS